MSKSVACCAVLSLLLILWPAAPAEAQEEKAKLMLVLEEYHVYPEKAGEMEALLGQVTEVFAAHDFPIRLDSYKMDDLRYLAAWLVEGSAGIDDLHVAWRKLMEEWGEEASADWTGKFFATMSHWTSSVWVPRMDLSYAPESQTDEYAYIVWGLLPIKPGHQRQVEEIFEEYVKVFAEHEVPHAWRAAEGFIGVEHPTLAFVEWAASPGSYWVRHDEAVKNEALSQKTDELWAKIMPHIRGFEWEAGHFLKDLSYRPGMEAEDDREF